jgi:glycosyltransferase involved in cell wall biosynthesis
MIKEKGNGRNPVVAFSGRFIPRKGIIFLLEAWQMVIGKFPGARLILLGEGPLLEEMKRTAVELGIGGSVDFQGHIGEVVDMLYKADIFVLPSLQEGMPNSLLEAMACRLPAVATRIGGVTDIVRDGENGVLVEPGDAPALAQGIEKLLGDGRFTGILAQNALQTIMDNYSLESIAPRYIGLYRKLAEP